MDKTIDRRTVLQATSTLGVGAIAGCTQSTRSGSTGGEETTASGTATETATTATGGASETITIGSPQGLTGRYSSVAQPIADALRLANERINNAGGIGDRTLNIQIQDSGWTVEEARPVVNKMINVDQMPLIVGLTSGILVPLWDKMQSAEVPVVSGYPGSTFLDQRGGDLGTPNDLSDDEWVWRTIASYANRLIGMAHYLQSERGAQTLSILSGSEPGDKSQTKAMRQAWTGLGGTLVNEITYRKDQSNFRTPLTKLYNEDSDVVYFSAPESDLAKIGQQWNSLGYSDQDRIVVVANGALSEKIFQPYFEGVLQASSKPAGPAKSAFEQRFTAYSDKEPNVWTYANWDAIIVGALAMERAVQRQGEITRETVQRNIGPVARTGGTKVSTFEQGKTELEAGNEINYEGAASGVNFDKYGNVSAAVNIQQFGESASTSVITTISLSKLQELQSQISG